MGLAVCRGVRLDMVCDGFDNHSQVLVHPLYHGVLCHILCDSKVFDEIYEGGVCRFFAYNNRIEFLCS